ncbi:MAG: glycerophosphodiester phosphodiesterase [Burkholderiales bacterium]|nr:glycerophosphodiester phosphodiesterase [Burkholderiales bacterium]MBK8665340.1 glycerophosphodiester phosphodiesterase [Burkholderiales bacterium]
MPLPRLRTALPVLLLGLAGLVQAFDLQGHRGARGLAPENTLAGFERALAIGVTTLELDIALSAEGVPVIVHDPSLPPDMTRDAQGEWLAAPTPLIRTLTLPELQAYDLGRAREGSRTARDFPAQQPVDGERLPTLAQLFERVTALGASQVRFNIETKTNPDKPQDTASPEAFVGAILSAVRAAGMTQRVTLQSFDWRTLRLAQQQAPEIPTAYLSIETRQANNTAAPAWTGGLKRADYPSVPHMVQAAGGRLWAPHHASLSETAVRQAQPLGLKVIPWTVNEPADMQRLIGWGVDGLITDYPDRLREAMRAAGLPLPPALPAR